MYHVSWCVYGGLPSFVQWVDTSKNFTSMYFQNRLILEGLENVLSTASVGVHLEKISLHRAMELSYRSNFSKCACSESKLIYIESFLQSPVDKIVRICVVNREMKDFTTPGTYCPLSLSPSSLMGRLQAAASSFFSVAMWALCDAISSSKCVTRDKACCLSISSSAMRSSACCWHSTKVVTTCWLWDIINKNF